MVTVDMHAHVAVPAVDALIADEPGLMAQRRTDGATLGETSQRYNMAQIGQLAGALVDVEQRLTAMDIAGVDVQAVSIVPLPHAWAEPDLAARIVELSNEGVAQHCAQSPSRLLGVATVSLQHPELAAGQLRDAVLRLGLRGVQISTSAGGGRELDHPDLDDFFATAAELDVPVLVHPWGCTLGARLDIGYMFNTVGNPTETTVALSRIIFGGVLDRHPHLRIWGAHGGGYLPSYSGRADHAWHNRADARTCAEPPSAYLRRMWFDSLVYTDLGLRHLAESVGADRITLGSDYPFDMGVDDTVARATRAGLPEEAVEAILGANALELLGTATRSALLADHA